MSAEKRKLSIICFSGDFDKAAAEQGHTVFKTAARDGHFHMVIRKGN